ncbi:MAG: hypothetical protein E7565_04640 [Ruminococcaceae bacterium]|nr:hypothetical protein [Oscillospiraceae bacterium]
MKEIKELKFEELTIDQKLGMVHTAMVNGNIKPEEVDFVFECIEKHSLGAIWIQFDQPKAAELMQRVKETADYPILIFTDAENGIGEYIVGRHNAIACTGDEKYAYAFGKTIGYTAKQLGYNVVCCPLMDINDEGSVRSFGPDKKVIAKMAAAEARGMHDAGVLTVGKHYPSGRECLGVDSHMAESLSMQTKEELLEDSLYAYMELIKEDLLDGLMSSHMRLPKIDEEYPASLSKKVTGFIREQGFKGFFITDALDMMGIRAKFGNLESKGMAVRANDLALPFSYQPTFDRSAIVECYEKGIFTEEELNDAVKRVLETQHKSLEMDKKACKELTEEEIYLSRNISRASVYARVDEGLTSAISRDGKHLFAIMVRNEMALGKVDVDTFSNGWLFPEKIKSQILELFPNSGVRFFHEFPTQFHNFGICQDSVKHDDVIFLTFSEPLAYAGEEALTSRVVSLIKALQHTNRVSALMHFGNPCILSALPHIPRVILGGICDESVEACIDVLAGKLEAKGVTTYDINLK